MNRNQKRKKSLVHRLADTHNGIIRNAKNDFTELWADVFGNREIPTDFTADDLSILLGLIAKAGVDRSILNPANIKNESPNAKVGDDKEQIADKVKSDVAKKTADNKTDTAKETAEDIKQDTDEEGKETSAEVKEAVTEAVTDVVENIEKAIETVVKDDKVASKLQEELQTVKEIVTKMSTNYDKVNDRLDALSTITKNTVNSVPAPQGQSAIDLSKLPAAARAFVAASLLR